MNKIYSKIIVGHKRRQAQLAILIDPDKFNPLLIELANECRVHYFFVGGSRLSEGSIKYTITQIKKKSKIPVVIFPGDEKQVNEKADALLFLSLLSGRNPDYLIGKQVIAAPFIRKKGLECIPTAYILIDGKRTSAIQKITKTKPLHDIPSIVNTAIAAELLGFKTVYLEAGSGAKKSIDMAVIKKVKQNIHIPLIVGGGIDSMAKAQKSLLAGADILVVGNALEKNMYLLKELSLLF